MSKNVYVFAEQRDGVIQKVAYELIGKARELAADLGQEVVAVVLGDGIQAAAAELFKHGADQVLVVDAPVLGEYSTEPYAQLSLKQKNRKLLSTVQQRSDEIWHLVFLPESIPA